SSWPELERAATADATNALVSAGRTRGNGRDKLRQSGLKDALDAGEREGAAPGLGDYRPDAHTGRVALEALSKLRPRLLFVGLGASAEYAHYDHYLGYIGALVRFDAWLGERLEVGDRLEDLGHPVTWFVTTDHGRAGGFIVHGGHPEAARTWLLAP